eukprot:scaffold14441_cov249-Amphora_coffeaeformis.AAC.1
MVYRKVNADRGGVGFFDDASREPGEKACFPTSDSITLPVYHTAVGENQLEDSALNLLPKSAWEARNA